MLANEVNEEVILSLQSPSQLTNKGEVIKLFFKNFKNFIGSIGLIYDEDTIDAKNYSSESKIIVLDAFKWFKQNNCQYKIYLCNYEKIINYLI